MKASDLDWGEVPNFSLHEWPSGVLDQMDARVIRALANARLALPPSHKLNPSPVAAAHVRATGASRHSTQGGHRLSDATDFFCDWAHASRTLQSLRRTPEIGGIGIYTDMIFSGKEGDRCMFHIDCRPERLEWVGWRQSRRDPINYVYLAGDPIEYHLVLAERGRWE